MDPSSLVTKLASVAEHLGIDVRFEWMTDSMGGLFTLRGKQVILVNEALPDAEKAAVLGEALASFDLEGVYLLPEVRDVIDRNRGQPG